MPLLKALDGVVSPSEIILSPPDLPLTVGRWPYPSGFEPNGPRSSEHGTFATFKDPIISRVHTKFTFCSLNNTIRICDQNSTNGTIVNGIRIEPSQEQELRDGDIVAFGGGGGFCVGEFVGEHIVGTPYIYRYFHTGHSNKRQRDDAGEAVNNRPEQLRRLDNGGEGASHPMNIVTSESLSRAGSISPRLFDIFYNYPQNGGISSSSPTTSSFHNLQTEPGYLQLSPPETSTQQEKSAIPSDQDMTTLKEKKDTDNDKSTESKSNEDQKLLSDLTSEFDCAICFQLMVAPHTVNPCGHMFCGLCLVGWFKQQKTCPECRTTVSSSQPMITAFKMNTVIDMIAKSSLDEQEKVEHQKRVAEWQLYLDTKRKADDINRMQKEMAMQHPSPISFVIPLSRSGPNFGAQNSQLATMLLGQQNNFMLQERQRQQQRVQSLQLHQRRLLQLQLQAMRGQLARARQGQQEELRARQEMFIRRAPETAVATPETLMRRELVNNMLDNPRTSSTRGNSSTRTGEASANPIDLTRSPETNTLISPVAPEFHSYENELEIRSVKIDRAHSVHSICGSCNEIIPTGTYCWIINNSFKFFHLQCYGVPGLGSFPPGNVRVNIAGASDGETNAINMALRA